ncbi:hypothetical protein ACLB1R_11790 [Escherichia coli]
MTMMYHAQERIVNLPGSEITQQRGGIHNSVTVVTAETDAYDRRLCPSGIRL